MFYFIGRCCSTCCVRRVKPSPEVRSWFFCSLLVIGHAVGGAGGKRAHILHVVLLDHRPRVLGRTLTRGAERRPTHVLFALVLRPLTTCHSKDGACLSIRAISDGESPLPISPDVDPRKGLYQSDLFTVSPF